MAFFELTWRMPLASVIWGSRCIEEEAGDERSQDNNCQQKSVNSGRALLHWLGPASGKARFLHSPSGSTYFSYHRVFCRGDPVYLYVFARGETEYVFWLSSIPWTFVCRTLLTSSQLADELRQKENLRAKCKKSYNLLNSSRHPPVKDNIEAVWFMVVRTSIVSLHLWDQVYHYQRKMKNERLHLMLNF